MVNGTLISRDRNGGWIYEPVYISTILEKAIIKTRSAWIEVNERYGRQSQYDMKVDVT